MKRTVTRDELDDELKRIKREGTERLVSITTSDEGFTITTEERDEPPVEIRSIGLGDFEPYLWVSCEVEGCVVRRGDLPHEHRFLTFEVVEDGPEGASA